MDGDIFDMEAEDNILLITYDEPDTIFDTLLTKLFFIS
jgi:hypothetical protein